LALTTKMLQPFIRVSWTWSANQLVRMPLFFFQPIVRKTLGLLISFPLSQSDNHQRKRKKARTVIQSQVSAVWLVFLIGGASPLWNGMANQPRHKHTHTGKERVNPIDIFLLSLYDFIYTIFLSLMVNLTRNPTRRHRINISRRPRNCYSQ
jgi:hypothetical protein